MFYQRVFTWKMEDTKTFWNAEEWISLLQNGWQNWWQNTTQRRWPDSSAFLTSDYNKLCSRSLMLPDKPCCNRHIYCCSKTVASNLPPSSEGYSCVSDIWQTLSALEKYPCVSEGRQTESILSTLEKYSRVSERWRNWASSLISCHWQLAFASYCKRLVCP